VDRQLHRQVEAMAVDRPTVDLPEGLHTAALRVEVLAIFSASHSVTQVGTDMDTDGTSQCHGGFGILPASDTTRDTDSESTVSEEAVDMEVAAAAVDMVEMEEEEDMVEVETAGMEVAVVDIKSPIDHLRSASLSPFTGPSTNKPDNCSSHSKFLLPFSIYAGHRCESTNVIFDVSARTILNSAPSHLPFFDVAC